MERLYKVSEVARMLNVSTVVVRKWIKAGKLRARRVGKLWMIPESELKHFLREKPKEIRAVIYARVSSHKQKRDGNLDRVWASSLFLITCPHYPFLSVPCLPSGACLPRVTRGFIP